MSIAGIAVPLLAANAALPPARSSLAAFIAALNGRTIGCDGFAAGQCTSLACAWCQNLGLTTPCGPCGAPDKCDGVCWQGSGFPGWTWIPNSPSGVPSPGDLVCYHKCTQDQISARGHVGIFVSGNAHSFTGFDQNWSGAFCALHTHGYECVVGWQHPTGTPPSSGPLVCPPGQVPVGSFCYPEVAGYPPGTVPLALLLGGLALGGVIAYQGSPAFRRGVQGVERRTGGILRASRR